MTYKEVLKKIAAGELGRPINPKLNGGPAAKFPQQPVNMGTQVVKDKKKYLRGPGGRITHEFRPGGKNGRGEWINLQNGKVDIWNN